MNPLPLLWLAVSLAFALCAWLATDRHNTRP